VLGGGPATPLGELTGGPLAPGGNAVIGGPLAPVVVGIGSLVVIGGSLVVGGAGVDKNVDDNMVLVGTCDTDETLLGCEIVEEGELLMLPPSFPLSASMGQLAEE